MTLEEMLAKTGQRQESFQIMIDYLKTLTDPLIIETGCARPPHPEWGSEDVSFKDEGWSTRLFDAYVNEYNGEFYSVDITPAHVEFATSIVSDKTNVVCDDSVYFLYQASQQLTESNEFVDLLYLDSFDFEPSDPHPSSVHHIKELTSIISRLRPGSLIAVDDNFGKGAERTGKGMYVAEFMEAIGKPMIYEGYQLIWKF